MKFWRLPLDAEAHSMPHGKVEIIEDRCLAGVCTGARRDCSNLSGACAKGICDEVLGRLPEDLRSIVDRFSERYGTVQCR